jgi:hypothetical protein
MSQSIFKFNLGRASKDSILGGVMQREIFNSHRKPHGSFASRFGALAAMMGLLMLSACGGGQDDVTDNDLAEPPFKDGTPPTLTAVSIRESTKSAKPSGAVKLGKSVRIDITASEGLMAPLVTINDVEAEVIGKVNGWYAVREITEADELGEIYFTIVYQDISGEVGIPVSETTDGSAVIYCDDVEIACPKPVSLPGDWRLDTEGGAGVGPAAGDVSWWNTDIDGVVETRACWFDDIFRFGADGSFRNVQGDETWLEPWQGNDGESCGMPVAPHDGSSAGTWEYDEAAGTMTISGVGSHLGLAKAVNGAELASPSEAPDSIVYDVVSLEGDSMTVSIDVGGGVWWTFKFARQPVSPLAGKWKLSEQGGAGVGPAAEDVSWWSTDVEGVVDTRACWFDDIYEFGADGSFMNVQGAETWLEPWQGASGETCGAPVAPHDGSNGAIYQYDEDASTLKLTGKGAYLGLAKAVNGAELGAPSEAPESVTYTITVLDGDAMRVTIDVGAGVWWTYNLERVSNSPLVGKWKLATEAGAGVGPAAGDLSWWNTDVEGVVEARACWFNDIYHFGDDGSFQNYQGDETWLEPWQGNDGESCGAPVAPHDGSSAGTWKYDQGASKLEIGGTGSYLGLAKTINGAELSAPSEAPESVVYDVMAQDGDTLQVAIDVGDGVWWTYNLVRVNDTAAVAGKWRLNPVNGAGVGPAPGDIGWWSTNIDGVVEARACLFDDVFAFGADGSFMNEPGADTWLEPWQGNDGESCGMPVAPHDGSARAIFEYDEGASTLTVHGMGAHLGLAKAVNGAELVSPTEAPDSVTYDVLALDGDNMQVSVDVGGGVFWTFELARVSNLPLVGNWKLDVNSGAGVGPAAGDISWWNTDVEGVVDARACWFDDVFHFGGGGGFQNFQDGDTWLEPWQGNDGESCGTPVAPHDGSSAGSYTWDEAAGTLTVRGVGSHIGLAKAVNGAELAAPSEAADSITYTVTSFDVGSLTVTIDVGAGVWWTFKLAQE